MEVLEKGMMLDRTLIQIEEWSTDYSFMPYGSTLALIQNLNKHWMVLFLLIVMKDLDSN
ncbi:hypothetical protein [Heyndrickxia sporothermodurans]|uniref:hypothetical protein n=1 Tax=Heyndrickxia sporothermodurans TaxID=46224 RepID=UPI0035DC17CF